MSTIADQVHAEETLSHDLARYVGQWVAVRGSKIVATAPTLGELAGQVGQDAKDTTVFEVGEDADVACFF